MLRPPALVAMVDTHDRTWRFPVCTQLLRVLEPLSESALCQRVTVAPVAKSLFALHHGFHSSTALVANQSSPMRRRC